jgi:hypothetical protein
VPLVGHSYGGAAIRVPAVRQRPFAAIVEDSPPPATWKTLPPVESGGVGVRSIAPVDLKVPDRLVEALGDEGARVGEPDPLPAAEIAHPG